MLCRLVMVSAHCVCFGLQKQSILSKISGSITGTPEITEEIDATLIGGFIVRMGDHQIDASVASQLQRLKQQFI